MPKEKQFSRKPLFVCKEKTTIKSHFKEKHGIGGFSYRIKPHRYLGMELVSQLLSLRYMSTLKNSFVTFAELLANFIEGNVGSLMLFHNAVNCIYSGSHVYRAFILV